MIKMTDIYYLVDATPEFKMRAENFYIYRIWSRVSPIKTNGWPISMIDIIWYWKVCGRIDKELTYILNGFLIKGLFRPLTLIMWLEYAENTFNLQADFSPGIIGN